MALTDEQVARFQADGFLFPVRACDASTAAANREAFDELEARLGRNNHFGVGDVPLHLGAEWAWRPRKRSPNSLLLLSYLRPRGRTLSA